jgi:hypothetical protein
MRTSIFLQCFSARSALAPGAKTGGVAIVLGAIRCLTSYPH